MKPTIKNAYSKKKGSTIETGKGLTEQSHKQQCDINYILRDYHKTGLVKHAAKHQGRYDDVTVQDFQEAMFLVTNAQRMFMELPADMRHRFQNDPGQFLGFVQDPANAAEMAEMGILKGNDGLDVSGAAVGTPVKPPAPPPDNDAPASN